MESQINFFREYRLKIRGVEKKRFLIQVSSMVALSVYLTIVLVVIWLLYYFRNQQNKINSNIRKAEAEIEQLRSIETKQIYLSEKIKSLEQIFDQRKEHQRIAKSFFALLPAGVSVDGFSIDEEQQIEFALKSEKFSNLKQFIANVNLSNQFTQLPIRSADVKSFRYKLKGGYFLDMKIGFLKEQI